MKYTLHLKESQQKIFYESPWTAQKRPFHVLVFTDLSDRANNVVEFALKLTRSCRGTISLIHVAAPADLPATDNPLKILRILEEIEAKQTKRLGAVKDMIHESGIIVVECESVNDKDAGALLEKVRKASPDLILSGCSLKFTSLNSLRSKVNCAWMNVPDMNSLPLPKRVLLVSDGKPIAENSLEPLFVLIQHTTQHLFVVLAKDGFCIGGNLKFNLPINGFNFRIHHVTKDNFVAGTGIDQFAADNNIDLICTINRPLSLMKRFFSTNRPYLTSDKPLFTIRG